MLVKRRQTWSDERNKRCNKGLAHDARGVHVQVKI